VLIIGFWEEHEFWGCENRIEGWIGGVWKKRVGNKGTFSFSPNWIKKYRLGELVLILVFLFRCMNWISCYHEIRVVCTVIVNWLAWHLGCKAFILILGIMRVLVWNWVRMTQSRIGVMWMDEITCLMFSSHCFMLGNDRILFGMFCCVNWARLGWIESVNRLETLQVLPKRVPPRLSESCRVSLWVLVRGSRLGD